MFDTYSSSCLPVCHPAAFFIIINRYVHEMGDKAAGGGEGDGMKKQQPTTSPKDPLDDQLEGVQLQQHHMKRARYEMINQRRLLLPSPSPSPHHFQQKHQPHHVSQTQTISSPTASSPLPSFSEQDTDKSNIELRKGKQVGPVWKPIEMLWLARAWRVQYQGTSSSDTMEAIGGGDIVVSPSARAKTRAQKDREVAEFLNRNGVERDAKTAGTKWDNMLGEFRKVYEWEKNSEREQVGGKSYFRLSPYERKINRLPASFDEDVYNELSHFMGIRVRSSHGKGNTSVCGDDTQTSSLTLPKVLPPPPLLKKDKLCLTGKTRQGMEGGEFESPAVFAALASSSSSREFRRVGRIRMIWEESLSIWSEGGEYEKGRVKVQGLSFLNADELTFFDDGMSACTLEAFEDGPLKGFSIDKFVSGQQVKVLGRRMSSYSGFSDRVQFPLTDPSNRLIPPFEYQDPSEYYVGCLRVPPTTLPTLFELSWHLQEPPPEDLRFPLRREVYRDLPQGKEIFFTTSAELLDCRAITFDIVSPIVRSNPSISSSSSTCRDSFIGLWDDCINRVVSKFCSHELLIVRKPSLTMTMETETLQDQWPNVMGFVRNLCLWRGEETDQVREGYLDPSSSIVEKTLWTFMDLPYILCYYAIGYSVTFCALSRSEDRVIRTDLYSVDLSTPTERLKALIPCWRIAGLLPLLADRCVINNNKILHQSDFERLDLGGGDREYTSIKKGY